MKKNVKASEKKILSAGNKARNLSDLMVRLGYSYTNAGSNTYKRLIKILGTKVFYDISQGFRKDYARKYWTINRVYRTKK